MTFEDYEQNQNQLIALGFEEEENLNLTDSQKAVLAEQADQQEKSIFELLDDIKTLADKIINYND